VKIHLIVALQQAAEEESIDALGLRIGGEARVEIGRAGFDEKGKRRTIGLVRLEHPERETAASARKERTRKKN